MYETVIDDPREVIRCPWCKLNQFITLSGLCRKPDCGKPLKANSLNETVLKDLETFYRPETPFAFLPSRVEAVIEKQIVPAFNTSKIVKDIMSNVRRKKPRGKLKSEQIFRINGFPDWLRLKAMDYARKHEMTLREVVIKSIEKMLDGK
jgi:hypothetical protein